MRHDVRDKIGGEFAERALLLVPSAGLPEEGQDDSYTVNRRGSQQSHPEDGQKQLFDFLAAEDLFLGLLDFCKQCRVRHDELLAGSLAATVSSLSEHTDLVSPKPPSSFEGVGALRCCSG